MRSLGAGYDRWVTEGLTHKCPCCGGMWTDADRGCSDCFYCEECEELHHLDDMEKDPEGKVCDKCYESSCTFCGEHHGCIEYFRGGDILCPQCYLEWLTE